MLQKVNRFALAIIIFALLPQQLTAQCNQNTSLLGVEVDLDFTAFDFNKAFQEDVLAKLPTGWQEPNGEKKGRFKYSLKGPLSVEFLDDQQYPLHLKMDLKFDAGAGSWVKIPIFKNGYVDIFASGDLNIAAKIGLTLDEDYKVVPQIEFTRFDMNNAGLAQLLFNLMKEQIKVLIKKAVAENINNWLKVSDKLDLAWQQLNTPVDIDNGYYAHINPLYWSLTNIKGIPNHGLRFQVGLQADLALDNNSIFNPKPKPTKFGLPNGVNPGNTWCLNVTAKSSYESLNTLLNKELTTKPWIASLKWTKRKYLKYLITGTTIVGLNDGKVQASVDYKRKAKSKKIRTIVYTARPSIDVPKQAIVLTDIKNQKVPRSVTEFALAVITFIDSDYQVSLEKQVTEAKTKLEGALNKKAGEVELIGTVQNLAFIGLTIEKENLQITGNSTGILTIKVFKSN